MLNKMQQEGGENSTNMQAGRDIHNHYGLSAEAAYDICRSVVKQELAIYFGEALKTAEGRFEKIANKVIDKIIADKPQLLSRFKEPDIQVAVNETYKIYIESGDEELGENLINMLIDRIESEERDTHQFVIDDARNLLPKMSKANLAFLAFHVFKLLNLPLNSRSEYVDILNKLRPVIERAITLSKLDLQYLKQSSCAIGIKNIQIMKTAIICLFNTYEYYFTKGISLDAYNKLLNKHRINKDDLGYVLSLTDSPMDNNMISVKFSNASRMETFFVEHNLPKVKALIYEFASLLERPTINDVKMFHINIDHNWDKAFSILDSQEITSLSITPVGVYMGSIYLKRILGIEIPQDIFYK